MRRLPSLLLPLLLIAPLPARPADGEPRTEPERSAAVPLVRETRLEGRLRAFGRELAIARGESPLEPAEVVALHRRAAERLPVDLYEGERDGGRLLSILDVHGGVHRVVLARPRPGGGSVVLRGEARLSAGPPAPPPLPLPEGFFSLGAVEDEGGSGRVITITAVSLAPHAVAAAELRRHLAALGLEQKGDGWRDGRRRIRVSLAEEAGACRALIRVEEER